MDYYINEMLELREEGWHIRGSIVATRDILSLRTIGEGCQEDKEEEANSNTTLPTPHHP